MFACMHRSFGALAIYLSRLGPALVLFIYPTLYMVIGFGIIYANHGLPTNAAPK